jgi:hypothetical protein
MKAEWMFYTALGKVADLFKLSDDWASFVKEAESTEESKFFTRQALKHKTNAIVSYDREYDRLVKEYGYDSR